jgi:hypothetical protein
MNGKSNQLENQHNKNCSNLNIGHSSRLGYDKCAYDDKLKESVAPLNYRLNHEQYYNCDQCLSTLGPRSSYNGNGVSTSVGHPVATQQALVDVESILTNRNIETSKCRKDQVNKVDVTKFQLQHMRICNDFLNPSASKLSYPAANYRDMAINRFYDLKHNAQANIFWDFSINTTLEAKDNFASDLPRPSHDNTLPKEIKGANNQCKIACNSTCNK